MAKVGLPALLKAMVDQDASDLHITTGVPPLFRIGGKMVKARVDSMNATDTKDLCYSVLTDAQKADFEKNQELDFSFGLKDVARFRGNVYYQKSSVAGVFRRVPMVIPDFDTLRLPGIIKKLVKRPNGLILVTGPTGSGKSTTLASMLDLINREEFGHIMTIEDPIEFVHQHKNCIVNQREVGGDTKGFGSALRRILRQDPDYILVGELRDAETIEMALTMAETGHLVFGTLHTNNAIQSINRIINSFSADQQGQVRQVLSFSLQACISQTLIPKSYEGGRVLACEVLIPNVAVRNLIREDKIHQAYAAMQTGQEDTGMMTMNQSLVTLVKAGYLSKASALENSFMPDEIVKMLAGVSERKK